MAGQAPSLPHALHPDFVVLAQFGRALFRDLTDFIIEKSFASIGELSEAIIGFLAERNQNAKRYVWHAKGEEILRKIEEARRAMAAALVSA